MPTPRAPLSLLLLGDTDRREFHRAREVLEGLGRVRHAPDAAAADAALADPECAPEVIVIAQAYPGQFSQAAVDALRRRAPLARVVALLGSWCEGEMRTGRPWPGVIRLYWHESRARCSQQLRRLVEGRTSAWDLPATTTEDERYLAAARTPWPKRQGFVAISTRRLEMEAWLAAACRECGYATVWLRPRSIARIEGAAAVIFDVADAGEAELDDLRRLAAQIAPAPLLALADFPRIEDVEHLEAAGAAAVLSKPLHADDLVWELTHP